MKTNCLLFIFSAIVLLNLVSCSTKKDKFVNRKFQALNTEYNVLYNGTVAFDKGLIDLKSQYTDDFWKVLPIERLLIKEDDGLPGNETKNANFQLSEEKATKAIQKRSMLIDGREKNSQIDEAHLLLGKSRYFEQRFVPALEAFNYILFKYPESDKIYEAKIWREKTNMRLDNDATAIKNLTKLLKDFKFKKQLYADANAALAQAFINVEQQDSAVAKMKKARDFTKSKEEKARYHYILGQLYEKLNYKDSAFMSYQSVIDMKRNAPKVYVIHAHERQLSQFDYSVGDTVVLLEKYAKLLEDRENRPFLDQLNYQMALYYDNQFKQPQAEKFYKKSLRQNSSDQYLVASNYRNLAKIHFDKAKYKDAGMYYDSTLTKLTSQTREFNAIKKKRENLNDVIKYEAIAQQNDSILNVLSLSKNDQISFYEKYIAKIKNADEEKAKLEKVAADVAARLLKDAANDNDDAGLPSGLGQNSNNSGFSQDAMLQPSFGPKTTNGANEFYFYNPQTVAFGKLAFRKKWGNRALKNNWRLSSDQAKNDADKDDIKENLDTTVAAESEKNIPPDPKYTTNFYIEKLPTDAAVIANLAKDRDFAYYQLGIIYKEKFKEYQLAAAKLEQLLANNPQERLILPAQYNLYKIYEIINEGKALAMKNKIIANYPNSRYAQIISNPESTEALAANAPEAIYYKMYKKFENEQFFDVLNESTVAVDKYIGTEIVPKFELLRATTIGKLQGIEAFKKALNYVALTYPNVTEGKSAEHQLSDNIPKMEALKFYDEKPSNWKILYAFDNKDSIKMKPLLAKLEKFKESKQFDNFKFSTDYYNMTSSFIAIHHMKSESLALGLAGLLQETKPYLIKEQFVVISNENYKIVQIKKNLDEYLKTPKSEPKTGTNATINNPNQSVAKDVNTNSNQNTSNIPPSFPTDPGIDLDSDDIQDNTLPPKKSNTNSKAPPKPNQP